MRKGLLIMALIVAGSCSKAGGPVTIKPINTGGAGSDKVKLGETLPAWEEGDLDIHFINNGRGECTFCIFPDGTTMLIDCSGAPPANTMDPPGTDPKPNASLTSSQVILNYVKHFMPAVSAGKMDYALLTHYHSDHMGSCRSDIANHPEGGFCNVGFMEFGASMPILKMVDRGPLNDPPSEDWWSDGTQKNYSNYQKYLTWSASKFGTVHERLDVGSTSQFVLKHKPSEYDFSVRNIAAGGRVWTGKGTEYSTNLPSVEELLATGGSSAVPGGNVMSCVITINYGKFNYFTGGDIQYSGKSAYGYKDIEEPISKVVGKVEAMKACHHGTSNTNSDALLKALVPDVILDGVWRSVQPNLATVKRMYAANAGCNIYLSNLHKDNITTLGSYVNGFSSTGGHIVIRVKDKGSLYYVYVLDDTDLKYKVTKVSGPFASK